MPNPLRLHHPVEAVRKVLAVLEAVDFKWTIEEVLDQDEAWVDDILALKSTGEDWQRIRQEQEDGLSSLSG